VWWHTWLEICDTLAAFQNNARRFMADDAVAMEDQVADATGFPEVKV
jgi:hypothetical protein